MRKHRRIRAAAFQVAAGAVVESFERRVLLAAVTGTSPLNGAQNVALASNVTVTFDVAMNAATLSGSTLQLRDGSNALVPAAVTYNATTRTATLDPTANLPAGNGYYFVRVVGGPAGVRDSVGGTLTNDYNFAFSTGTPAFAETTVFSGLLQPTAVEFSPDGRVFVAEKRGIIRVFDSLTDTTPEIFADLRTNTHNYHDRGLLGLALHPQFPSVPKVYVLYTHDADIGGTAPKYGTVNGDSDAGATQTGVSGRLSVLTASGNTATGSEQVLVEDWVNQFPSHSIGHIQFGPDGFLYASSGDGASFSNVDYGQFGNPFNDPVNEGGALRSQDVRTTGDPTGLDGTIIRIDPNTGAPAPGNPLSGDTNRRRIIAYGLRNPFRFNFRPGTGEIWSGDVGWNAFEEINRIRAVGDGTVENFGWPAYEGPNRQSGYDAANLPLLESLYTTPNGHDAPYYAWAHSDRVVPGSSEPTGGSSSTGIAFYDSGNYPLAYDGAMFFADYSRKQIYVMYAGPDGLPNVSNRQIFKSTTNGAVELQTGPNGDLFYVDLNGGRVQRFAFTAAGQNRAPTAAVAADRTTGNLPLTVNFSGAGSSDPDAGDVLDFSWDLDGDGVYGDSTAVAPSFTYTTTGARTVRLRVTDRGGLSSVASVTITPGSSAPTPIISTPLTSLRWRVGDAINFSGSAVDAEDGTLAAARLRWDVVLIHGNEIDPTNTHEHPVQSFSGIAAGSFVAPDHEWPSWLELRLTATDSSGLSTTVSQRVDPQTVTLNFASSPSGLRLSFNGTDFTTPFQRTAIVGSSNSLAAIAQGNANGYYEFVSWAHGGLASQQLVAPAAGTTYTATFANRAAGDGLRGQYFDNADFTGTTFSRTDSTLNFDFGTGSPDPRISADTFSVRWTGQILAPVTGLYQFFTNTDDGVRLWVNNELLIDRLVTQTLTEWSATTALVAGQRYDLRVDYFEQTGSARAELRWQFPGAAKAIVPGQFLYTAAPAVAPAAPANLSAVVVTSNRVDLSWNDNADNESGFEIQRRFAGWIWENLPSVAANVTGYSDTQAIGNVLYEYRVRAFNAAGPSAWTNPLPVNTANVGGGGVPASADGLSAVTISSTRVRLTWSDNSGNETGFRVERRVAGQSAWATVLTAAADATTADDTTVAANTSYEYRVVAFNAGGDAQPSNIATATTAASGVPAAPSNLAANVLSTGAVKLDWTDNSTNETGFIVERRFAAWIWEQIAVVGPNIATYTDPNAIRNVLYEYRVAAASVSGPSPYSPGVFVNVPPPPAGLSVMSDGATMRLVWSDEAVNETGYAVQRRAAPGTGGSKQWNTVAVLPPDSKQFAERWRTGRQQYRVFALGTIKDGDSASLRFRGRPADLTVARTPAPLPVVMGPFWQKDRSLWSALAI